MSWGVNHKPCGSEVGIFLPPSTTYTLFTKWTWLFLGLFYSLPPLDVYVVCVWPLTNWKRRFIFLHKNSPLSTLSGHWGLFHHKWKTEKWTLKVAFFPKAAFFPKVAFFLCFAVKWTYYINFEFFGNFWCFDYQPFMVLLYFSFAKLTPYFQNFNLLLYHKIIFEHPYYMVI